MARSSAVAICPLSTDAVRITEDLRGSRAGRVDQVAADIANLQSDKAGCLAHARLPYRVQGLNAGPDKKARGQPATWCGQSVTTPSARRPALRRHRKRPPHRTKPPRRREIGRASCRERVCQYV